MARKVISVFSDTVNAEKSMKSIFNKVTTIVKAYTQGSIASVDDKKQAVKVLRYSIAKMDEMKNGLKGELISSSMLSTALEDGSVMEPIIHNLAIVTMSADLTADTIENDLEENGEVSLEDALTMPEDADEEVADSVEADEGGVEDVISDEEDVDNVEADEDAVAESVEAEDEVVTEDDDAEVVTEDAVEEEEPSVSETSHNKINKISASAIRTALFGK